MKNHHLKYMDQDPKDHSPELEDVNYQDNPIRKFLNKQTKQTRLIILISVIGLLIFTLIAATFSFKDQLFQALYPKPVSQAADPIDDLTRQLLEGNNQLKLVEQSIGITKEATPSPTTTFTPPTSTPSASPTPTLISTPTPATSSATESTTSAVQGETTNPKLQEKQQVLTNMVDIAKKRKELLLEKMRLNPQEFLNKATLVNQRDILPESVKPYIEQKVQDEGKLVVIHLDDFNNKKSTYEYFLTDKSTNKSSITSYKYKLHFTETAPQALTGSDIKINGVSLDKESAVTSLNVISAVAAQPVIGDQKTIVMLIRLANDTSAPTASFTRDYINNFMFGTAPDFNSVTVNSYYKDNSFNKLSFSGDVVGEYVIPNNSICDLYSWAFQADTAAVNAGVNLGNYQRRMYVFKTTPDSCVGRRNQGGGGTLGETPSRSWIFDKSWWVYIHELGHNLGVAHANFLSCRPNSIDVPSRCQNTEYGDYTDIMGLAGPFGLRTHFNGPHKAALGWIPTIQTVSNSGTYTIAPLEDPTSQPQILKISKPDTGEYYYISYRQKTGYDSSFYDNMVSGAYVHVWNETPSSQTKELDTTPGTSDTLDAPLTDGTTFTDQINNISIKQISHTLSSGANLGSVTLQITLPTSLSPRVFVTSATMNGNIKAKATSMGIALTEQDTSLTAADKICKNLADNSTIADIREKVWKVWLGDNQTSAADRLTHTSGVYKRLDGATVANNWADLTDGSLQNPISLDENRVDQTRFSQVWTGTGVSGNSLTNNCNNWTSSTDSYFGNVGYNYSRYSQWTDSLGGPGCSSNFQRLYCFEEPAPSPTPTPTPTPPPSVTYSLSPGWSAIGIPFSGFTAETLMTGSQYVNNKCDRLLGADKVWDKNLPSVFITLHDLGVNQGYWIRCNEPVLFTLTGTSSPSLQIAQGWNLITMPLKAVQPLQSSTFMSDQTLANNNCQTIRELGLSEPYFTTTPELLTVGQGYYLYCNSAFTITFANNFINNASVLSFNTSPISLLSRPEIPAIPTPTPSPTPTPTPRPKPDLVVNKISVSTPRVRRSSSISIEIQNTSKSSVTANSKINAAVSITKSDGSSLGNCSGTSRLRRAELKSKSKITVSVRNCPKFTVKGDHTITATVDPKNIISESNENNNTLEITVKVR